MVSKVSLVEVPAEHSPQIEHCRHPPRLRVSQATQARSDIPASATSTIFPLIKPPSHQIPPAVLKNVNLDILLSHWNSTFQQQQSMTQF